MALDDQELNKIRRLSDDDLIAQSGDQARLLESNLRMRRSAEKLTGVLIFLNMVLVVLTVLLVALGVLALEPIVNHFRPN